MMMMYGFNEDAADDVSANSSTETQVSAYLLN